MKVELWPLGRPIPYARNARIIPDSAVSKVASSIKEFGFRQPIVVDGEDVIVAGHTRLLAAQKLRLAQVPVVVAADLTPAQVKAYRLADNRTAQEASWEYGLLNIELEELSELDIDLLLTGFDPDELAGLPLKMGATDVVEDEAPEPPDDPITQPGDLWLLGEHRVLCGDATDAACVFLLMGKRAADMVLTDPPYGLDRNLARAAGREWRVANDDPEAAPAMYAAVTAFPAPERYVWGAWNTWGNLTDALGEPDNCIVWVKSQMGMGHGYRHQHEFCAYFGSKSFADQSDVWVESRDHSGLHPTMKPVSLCARAISNSSSEGALIADPFLGSGTTLIAAEQTGRICYGMEIDPRYCDVIVRRWENLTGRTGERTPAEAD